MCFKSLFLLKKPPYWMFGYFGTIFISFDSGLKWLHHKKRRPDQFLTAVRKDRRR